MRFQNPLRAVCPVLACLASAFFAPTLPAGADSIELVNGDVYSGTLVSINQSNFVFQSEIQGLVTLPRSKVAGIIFRDSLAVSSNTAAKPAARPAQFSLQFTNRAARAALPPPREANAVIQQLRRQGIDSNLVTHVQEQILAKSTPEASQKFDELLGGLVSGRISLDDIRSQAQTSLENIQEAKKIMGDDMGGVLDGYLVILQNFLNETTTAQPSPASATNKP